MIVGNYLPKARQNGAIGMRVKWTLKNEECWNATHRFGGKVFFICGVLCLFSAFLPTVVSFITIMGLLLVASVVTIIYSYVYYKKHTN